MISYVNASRPVNHRARVWAAKVVLILITIIRKTSILPPSDHNALKVLLLYLSLEKSQCEAIVGTMNEALR